MELFSGMGVSTTVPSPQSPQFSDRYIHLGSTEMGKVLWRADVKSRALATPFRLRNLQHHLVDAQTGIPLRLAQVLRLEAWKIRGGPCVQPVGSLKK